MSNTDRGQEIQPGAGLGSTPGPGPHAMIEISVVLYSKPDCTLCDQLKDDLDALSREAAFEAVALQLVERNIETDPELQRKFQYLVPVLAFADGELLYPPHHYAALYTALEQARRQAVDIARGETRRAAK